VKSLIRFTWCISFFGLVIFQAQAAFTSLYIFGDGVSTTTNNTIGPASLYYGLRYCNGRVWVELLAQQLGLTNNYWYSTNSSNQVTYTNLTATTTNWSYSSNDWSFFGDFSPVLVANVSNFIAPANASNDLFIVWVDDADFVGYMENSSYSPYTSNNIAIWTNSINQSVSNHFVAITNLYTKGVRTLVMPDAVDITEVPGFSGILSSASKSFVRQMVINFNTAFAVTLSNAMVSCPGLKIYEPDFFSLLDNMLTNASAYGLTNALYSGHTIDAVDAYYDGLLSNINLNGPGTNYIFWDYLDPTAKVQAILADTTLQLIAPSQFSQITSQNGTNQLALANVPIGLNGVVLGSTNLALTNWTTVTNFNSTSTVQSVFVPVSGPLQFYRLSFPFAWTWP
jgi:phospholipase/lecithinase/hemolysin